MIFKTVLDFNMMNDDRTSGCMRTDESWIQHTHLFRQWSSMKREINQHKWYQSEKAGHDIGWDRASIDWTIHHSADFFKNINKPAH